MDIYTDFLSHPEPPWPVFHSDSILAQFNAVRLLIRSLPKTKKRSGHSASSCMFMGGLGGKQQNDGGVSGDVSH